MSNLADLFAINSAQIASSTSQRLETMLAKADQVETSGQYQTYDGETGLHIVKLQNGGLIAGRLISSGAVLKDQMVSVIRTDSGIASFDVMPR